MLSALFIGRFQPFHLGHLSVIKNALEEVGYLIIGIGSAEANFQPDNPFTAGERFQMIKETLDAEKIAANRYCIIPIRNIDNYSLWCTHVTSLTPPFQIIYSGSPLVKKLFLHEKKFDVRDVKEEIEISATEIRKLMRENTKWQKFVHPRVTKLIGAWKGVERLKTILLQ